MSPVLMFENWESKKYSVKLELSLSLLVDRTFCFNIQCGRLFGKAKFYFMAKVATFDTMRSWEHTYYFLHITYYILLICIKTLQKVKPFLLY